MDIHGANGSWRMELHSIHVIYWGLDPIHDEWTPLDRFANREMALKAIRTNREEVKTGLFYAYT